MSNLIWVNSKSVIGIGALIVTGVVLAYDLFTIHKNQHKLLINSQTIKLCITGGP